jgi:DNA-binding CsgD family transcriptional regulator
MANDFLQTDVTVVENFKSYQVQHWDEDRLKFYNQSESLISLYKEFDMTACYAHGASIAATGKNGSMFCFTGSSIELNKRTEAILEFVTPHLHLALSQLYNNKQLEWNKAIISEREKEVLNWLKQGKSSWDISVILAISERTVNYHVYNIMDKLGATNRPQAVAIGARLGLIEFG